jgi:hypothetical protein
MIVLAVFRPSRRRVGPDPHLDTKIVLFVIGAAFGAAGMITGRNWIVFIGIAILLAGVLLGLRRPATSDEYGEDEEQGNPDDTDSGETRGPGRPGS